MKFLVAALFLVAGALAQNPYEYVDDALIQRVGKIIYDFDQKVAASRSSGNTGAVNVNSGSGYQVGKPEGVSRVSNFDYNNANTRQVQPQQQVYQQRPVARAVQQPQQQVYQQPQQQTYQQRPVTRAVQQPQVYQQPQQQTYQQRPVARAVQQPQVYQQPQQQTYQQRPVARSVQQPIMQQQQQGYQNYRSQRQFVPSAPVPRTFQQEPEMVQKNSGFGYVLSEPEIIPRVAEFHFTDGEQQDSQSQDSFRSNRMGSNRRF